jgi:hypothetical protein
MSLPGLIDIMEVELGLRHSNKSKLLFWQMGPSSSLKLNPALLPNTITSGFNNDPWKLQLVLFSKAVVCFHLKGEEEGQLELLKGLSK